MYGCESWTIKKAKCQVIDAFEVWCWRRLLGVPWAPRRSNQSILKEIRPEYALEGHLLKLQYFRPLMWRASSLEMTLMLGNIEDRRRRGDRGWDDWMASPTQWTWVEQTPGDSEGQGSLVYSSPGLQRVLHDWASDQHNFSWNWTQWAVCIFWKLIWSQFPYFRYCPPFWVLSFHVVCSFLRCAKVFKNVPVIYFCFYIHHFWMWVKIFNFFHN